MLQIIASLSGCCFFSHYTCRKFNFIICMFVCLPLLFFKLPSILNWPFVSACPPCLCNTSLHKKGPIHSNCSRWSVGLVTLSMCLNQIHHQRLRLMTPKPAPPSWAWNRPPQEVTWSGRFWSLLPSGGSDKKSSVICQVAQWRHVRVASFASIFAETSSSMTRCWGRPTSPSKRSGRVLRKLSGMIEEVMLYPGAQI